MSLHHPLDALLCPYRNGVGTCGLHPSCQEEPSCITDEPEEGWLTAVHEALSCEAEQEDHDRIGDDGFDCGDWTWDPPCGGCVGCLHKQISYSYRQGREELAKWIEKNTDG